MIVAPVVVAARPEEKYRIHAQRGADLRTRGLGTLRILVREALAAATQGHSDEVYIRSIARMRLASVDVGTKYHSRQCAELVEVLSAQAVRWATFRTLDRRLPGLGIPSDSLTQKQLCQLGALSHNLWSQGYPRRLEGGQRAVPQPERARAEPGRLPI